MDELKNLEIGPESLEGATGGVCTANGGLIIGNSYTTRVRTGYLALRNYPAYDSKNEIGPLWNGSVVTVIDTCNLNSDYVVVCVNIAVKGPWGPATEGRVGYVNWHYLT